VEVARKRRKKWGNVMWMERKRDLLLIFANIYKVMPCISDLDVFYCGMTQVGGKVTAAAQSKLTELQIYTKIVY
jgi:hypothetical protein